MSFYHPFGDHAPLFVIGAIALGFMIGIGVSWWVYPLVLGGLYVLIQLFFAILTPFEDRMRPKEDRLRQKEEDHCNELLNQAYHACARASGQAKTHQKSWQEPQNREVRHAIQNPEDVDLPELFEVLQTAWGSGDRDSELALHLMYTAWYLWEPGYDEYTCGLADQTLQKGFQQPYHYLGGSQSNNCTLLLTSGHMILLFDYRTGLTLADARACLERFLEICPDGIPISEFAQRGDFGEYFSHIINTGVKRLQGEGVL